MKKLRLVVRVVWLGGFIYWSTCTFICYGFLNTAYDYSATMFSLIFRKIFQRYS